MFGTSKKVLNTLLDEKYDEIAQLKVENQRLKKEILEAQISNQNRKIAEDKVNEYLLKRRFPESSLLKVVIEKGDYLAVFVKEKKSIFGITAIIALKRFSVNQKFEDHIGDAELQLHENISSLVTLEIGGRYQRQGYASFILTAVKEYSRTLGKRMLQGRISAQDYERKVIDYPQGKYGELLVHVYQKNGFDIIDLPNTSAKKIIYDLTKEGG